MLRPLTRSSSGKLGRNARHSSKKLPHLLKNHVANSHRETPQIRRSISRKSINVLNLITSRPKLTLSDSASKGKRVSNDVPKTYINQLHFKSQSILGIPIPQLRKKSMSRRHFQDESPLNARKDIAEIEQSISTGFRRRMQSSMGNIHDTDLIKNRSHKSRLAISLRSKSTEKHIKLKTTAKVKDLNVTTEESKRVTRSSIGNISCNTLLKSRRSKDRFITLHPSTEKHIKCKEALKEKNINVITESPKRVTRSSIGNTIVTSSLKKISKDRFVSSSVLKHAEKSVDSKHLSPSSFQIVTDSVPLVKKTPKSKILILTSLLSAQVGIQSKKSEKEAVVVRKDSEQIKRRSLKNVLPSLKSTEKESEKQQRKTRNAAPASGNSTKAALMKSVEPPIVTPMSNTRKSNSGSLSARKLPKRKRKSSTVNKGVKRKSTESPLKDKRKKKAALKTPVANEDNIPLDCLTMHIPNKRPRRHTVDVCVQNKKAQISSTRLQKTKKISTAKTKRKSSKQRKDNGTSSKSNSMSSSAPDMSQFPIDCLTTFQSKSKSVKKRPKSAPAGIKRKSKAAGFRTPIPRKGTLKRQRWMFNALKDKNEGYEDDIFENLKLQTPAFRILNEADDESDSSIPTPKFGFMLTPALPKKTPKYKETISSSDLFLARKNAEEYLFRRNKKRTSDHETTLNSPSQTSVACDEVPEKKKLEFTEIIEKVEAIRKDREEKNEDDESEDDYFTDALF